MTAEKLTDAIFGGSQPEQHALQEFFSAHGIRFPALVAAIPDSIPGAPANASDVDLRLHAGIRYRFEFKGPRPAASVRRSPYYSRDSRVAIQAIRESILALRQRQISELAQTHIPEQSLQVEVQAFHLAMQEVRERGTAEVPALTLWLEVILKRHQRVIHGMRQKLLEFLCQLTRGVDADLSYPFYRATQQIFATYSLPELAKVFRESVTELAGLVAGRRAMHPVGAPEVSSQVLRAFEYMEKSYTQAIGLREVAAAAFTSAGHLARLFKKQTGRTVVDHLHLLRVTRAKELLATTEESVLEVALGSGFPTIEHFHRVFRKSVGLTPRAYRLSSR